MTILDLACGTGVSTKEILKNLGETGKIYAVDFSEAMLNLAKKEIKKIRMSFLLNLWLKKLTK